MSRLIPLIISLIMTTASYSAVSVNHLTKRDGLSGTIVSDLFQDRNGFIWVGTWEGLSRYDGYEFVNYNTRSSSSTLNNFHNRIVKIFQDKGGNIWVTTYNDKMLRLNRQTGEFEAPYYNQDVRGDVRMKTPLFASDGTVWINLEGQGLLEVRTDSLSNSMASTFHPLENVRINTIFEDPQGSIWVASEGDLKILRSQSLATGSLAEGEHPRVAAAVRNKTVWGTADGRLLIYDYTTNILTALTLSAKDAINAVAISPGGKTIYAGTHSGKVYAYDAGHKRKALIKDFSTPISLLHTDSHGMLWMMTQGNGIGVWRPGTSSPKLFNAEHDCAGLAPLPPILEKDGYLWMCLDEGTIYRYDYDLGIIIPIVSQSKESPASAIKQFLVSSPRSLWVATERRGLDRITISDNIVHSYGGGSSKSKTLNAKAFFADNDSSLWIGSKNGHISILDKEGRLETVIDRDDNGMPLGKIYTIVRDPKGIYWAAIREEGIIEIEKRGKDIFKTRRYVHSQSDRSSLSDNQVQDILIDSAGRMWVATYGGGINIAIHNDSGTEFINALNTMKSFPISSNDKMRSLAEGNDGTIWGATTDGLVGMTYNDRTRDINVKLYRHDENNPSSLPGNDLTSLCVTPDGTLWIGTLGGGLCRMAEEGKFEPFGVTDGLPSNHVQSIVSDNDGNLWVTTENNISLLNPATCSIVSLNELDGIPQTIFTERASFLTQKGTVIFGTQYDCLEVDPRDIALLSNGITPLYITRIETSGYPDVPSPVSVPESIRLSSSDSEITLSLASLDYGNQQHTCYQWSLDSDTTWVNLSRNSLTLSHLPEGKHKINFRAFPAGNPAAASTVSLDISVPRKLWINILIWLFLIIVIAVDIAYSMRHRKDKGNQVSQSTPDLMENRSHAGNRGRLVSIAPAAVRVDKNEDAVFIEDLMEWMETHYSDPDLKINDMAAATGMGRTVFYKKLKTLLKTSPVDFVIEFRLKKACMMMKETKKSVAEVAYLTGYSDPHYFTRAFKTRYRMTPTQYRTANHSTPSVDSELQSAENTGHDTLSNNEPNTTKIIPKNPDSDDNFTG